MGVVSESTFLTLYLLTKVYKETFLFPGHTHHPGVKRKVKKVSFVHKLKVSLKLHSKRGLIFLIYRWGTATPTSFVKVPSKPTAFETTQVVQGVLGILHSEGRVSLWV